MRSLMICTPHPISRRMRWTGHAAHIGERRGAYTVLVAKPEGKRPLAGPRYRWEDNTEMDLQEVECGDVDWIDLALVRDMWRAIIIIVMNLRIPFDAWNFLFTCEPVKFSGRTVLHEASRLLSKNGEY